MNRQVPKTGKLFPVFSIVFFDTIATTIGYPVLTFLCFDPASRLFTADVSHMSRSFWFGICSAAPNFIAIITAPLLGFISDHWGRRPLLILGSFSALLLCGFTTLSIFCGAVALLIAGCLIAGFCARIDPIAIAVVGDLSEPKRKIINMGYLQLSISLGATIGPLLGGYLAQKYFFKTLNFSLPYLVGTVAALLTLFVACKYFYESYQPRKREKTNWRGLLNPEVVRISLILILTQISWRTYYQFMPPVLKINFHYSAAMLGVFLAVVAVWLSLATAFGVRWLNRYLAIDRMIKVLCYAELLGLLLATVGSVFSWGWLSQILIWFSIVPVAVSDVVIFCAITTLYSGAVSSADQGKVMGFCFTLVAAIWVVTGFFGGILAGINIALPILCAPLSLIILLLIIGDRSNAK